MASNQDQPDPEGWPEGTTDLIRATRHRQVDRVATLLQTEGLEVDGTDGMGNTALQYAAMHETAELAGMLLDGGADPKRPGNGGLTALHDAVIGHELHGSGQAVTNTLISAGADLRALNGDGNTAYLMAVANDLPDLVELLLDARAETDAAESEKAQDALEDYHSLRNCAQEGYLATMQVILKLAPAANKGALENGVTALMVSAAVGKVAPMAALLEAGADVHATNVNGDAALAVLLAHGTQSPEFDECLELLLSKGAELPEEPAQSPATTGGVGSVGAAAEGTLFREGTLKKLGGFGGRQWQERVVKLYSDGTVEFHKGSFQNGKTTLELRSSGKVLAAASGGGTVSRGFALLLTIRRLSGGPSTANPGDRKEHKLKGTEASNMVEWLKAFHKVAERLS